MYISEYIQDMYIYIYLYLVAQPSRDLIDAVEEDDEAALEHGLPQEGIASRIGAVDRAQVAREQIVSQRVPLDDTRELRRRERKRYETARRGLLGSFVRSFVGSFVGSLVGSFVGSSVGSLVGSLLGCEYREGPQFGERRLA